MKVTGIIAEYNPFHKGHQYHLERARQETDADYIIVVMSGNYTQRGLPAVMDKYLRAQTTLQAGADLVLELPTPYATGSAEFFASGAVALLDKLGVIDHLCFGSECGRTDQLMQAAALLAHETSAYSQALQKHLAAGLAYPAAQEAALLPLLANAPVGTACPDKGPVPAGLLSSPNNRLGMEYCKALVRRNSPITPVTIQRVGAGYHDEALYEEPQTFSSATAIRKLLLTDASPKAESGAAPEILPGAAPESFASQMPDYAAGLIRQEWQQSLPLSPDDFSLLLHCRLLRETARSLTSYQDVSQDLADKIIKHLPDFTSFTEYCRLLKSKDLTYTRISRSLLHILLNIREEDVRDYVAQDYLGYARILGFRREAAPLLGAIKSNAALPLLSKLADADKVLAPKALAMLEQDIAAAHLYEAVATHKFSQNAKQKRLQNEYRRQIIIQ